MNEERSSYRQILRSTSIVGGATAGSILIGLVRMKVFTLLIGAAGIGLLGVFNAIVMAGALLAGLGISTSGVRELAAAGDDSKARDEVRRALWTLTWLLALAGGAVVWVFREPIARAVAGGEQHASAVGWLGLAVGLNVIAASQSGVLQGFQRIGDVGRVKLYGSLLATVLGIAAVYADHYWGIVASLIAVPLALVLVAAPYQRSLPRPQRRGGTWAGLATRWHSLVGLGIGVMLWYAMSSITQVVVRAFIVRENGLEAAGLFQASWIVSSTYLNLILAAMSADYLPRLSAVSADRDATGLLVDRQLRVALLLGFPLIASMIASAPWLLTILYSSEFSPAARLLQWQLAGDILKLAGWALSFVLLARKDMPLFLLAEAGFSILYLALLYLLLPGIGLEAAGVGYFVGYFFYTLLIAATCWRRHRITMSGANLHLTAACVVTLVLLVLLAAVSQAAALVVGAALSGFSMIYVVRHLGGLAAEDGKPPFIRAVVQRIRRRVGRR